MQYKEYFYIGHYVDTEGNYVLKIGTTGNLDRRAKEHNRNYARAKTHTLGIGEEFTYDWWIPLSKYNTLRVEDNTRDSFISCGFGHFVANDRFVFPMAEKPTHLYIGVRKSYRVVL